MMQIELQSNEGVILQSENVNRKLQKGSSKGDLILTNHSLYHVCEKGAFHKTKEIAQFPLNQIKVLGGQAQVKLGGNNTEPRLVVYLLTGQEEFSFTNIVLAFQAKKEILKWVNSISEQLTGKPSQEVNDMNIMAIPGTEQLAGTLKDTVGAFKGAIGIKSKKEASLEKITCKCIGCMAPLSGVKGQTIQCKYCDTEQTL